MDSKLVVEQMSGRWKIKHEDMRRLALEAREVAADISAGGGSVRFTWIPRAENTAADALANAAMDGKTISRRLDGDPARQNGDGDDGAAAAAADLAAGTSPADPVGLPTSAGPPGWSWCATGSPTSPWRASSTVAVARTPASTPSASSRSPPPPGGACLPRRRPGAGRLLSLARGVQTGAAVAAAIGVQLETDEDWDEQAFGDWDGKSVGQLAARYPAELARLREDDAYARVGGESHRDMAKRVLAAFERRRQQRPAGGRGDAPQADHGRARPRARHPARPDLAAGHLAGVAHRGRDVVRRRAMVPFVNDTSHLR